MLVILLYIILVKRNVPFDVIEYGAELSAIWLLFVGALISGLSEAVSKSAGSVCGTSA